MAPEEIVEPADPVPPVAIGFDHQPVLPALVGMTVILGQKVDQHHPVLGILPVQPDRKCDLMRLGIEVVNEQHPIVAPIVSHHQHGRIVARYDSEIAPANLGNLLAHADDPLRPI